MPNDYINTMAQMVAAARPAQAPSGGRRSSASGSPPVGRETSFQANINPEAIVLGVQKILGKDPETRKRLYNEADTAHSTWAIFQSTQPETAVSLENDLQPRMEKWYKTGRYPGVLPTGDIDSSTGQPVYRFLPREPDPQRWQAQIQSMTIKPGTEEAKRAFVPARSAVGVESGEYGAEPREQYIAANQRIATAGQGAASRKADEAIKKQGMGLIESAFSESYKTWISKHSYEADTSDNAFVKIAELEGAVMEHIAGMKFYTGGGGASERPVQRWFSLVDREFERPKQKPGVFGLGGRAAETQQARERYYIRKSVELMKEAGFMGPGGEIDGSNPVAISLGSKVAGWGRSIGLMPEELEFLGANGRFPVAKDFAPKPTPSTVVPAKASPTTVPIAPAAPSQLIPPWLQRQGRR